MTRVFEFRDMRVRSKALFYCANIIVPLIAGLLIYIHCRSSIYALAPIQWLYSYPSQSTRCAVYLRNYAADILWAYSLTFAVQITIRHKRKNLMWTFFVCSIFACVIESMQKIGVFSGTFDITDIALELASICFAVIIIRLFGEVQR